MPALANNTYPEMTGIWVSEVRQMSSGSQVSGQVASGGVVISDVTLTLNVFHQDGEVFMGEVQSSAPNSAPIAVWGSIRSRGDQGVFITANGSRGDVWFYSPNEFEFCLGNQNEANLSSYCGKFVRPRTAQASND